MSINTDIRNWLAGSLLALSVCLAPSCQKELNDPVTSEATSGDSKDKTVRLSFAAEVEGFDTLAEGEDTSRTLPITRKENKMVYPFTEGEEMPVTLIFQQGGGMIKKITYENIIFTYTNGKFVASEDIQLPTVSDWNPNYMVSGYIGARSLEKTRENEKVNPWSPGYMVNRLRWEESGTTFQVTPRKDDLREQLYAAYYLDWTHFEAPGGGEAVALQKLKFKPNGVILRLRFENTSDNAFRINSFTIKGDGLSKYIDAYTAYSGQAPRIQWQKPGSNEAQTYTFNLLTPITLKRSRSEGTYWIWFGAYGNSLATGNYPITITINGQGSPGSKTSYTLTKTIVGPKGSTTHGTIPLNVKFAAQGTPSAPPPPIVEENRKVYLPLEFLTESSWDAQTRQFYTEDNFINHNEGSLLGGHLAEQQNLVTNYQRKNNSYFLPDYLDWVTIVPASINRNSMQSFAEVEGFWNRGAIFFGRRNSSEHGQFSRMEQVRLRDKVNGSVITQEKNLSATYNLPSDAPNRVYAIRFEGGDNTYRSAWRYEYTHGQGLSIKAIRLSGDIKHSNISTISDESWWHRQETNPTDFRNRPVVKRYLAVGGNKGSRERDGRYICKKNGDAYYFLQFSDLRTWIQRDIQTLELNRSGSVRFFKHDPESEDTRLVN